MFCIYGRNFEVFFFFLEGSKFPIQIESWLSRDWDRHNEAVLDIRPGRVSSFSRERCAGYFAAKCGTAGNTLMLSITAVRDVMRERILLRWRKVCRVSLPMMLRNCGLFVFFAAPQLLTCPNYLPRPTNGSDATLTLVCNCETPPVYSCHSRPTLGLPPCSAQAGGVAYHLTQNPRLTRHVLGIQSD
jgi:hypothetical protein